MHSLRSMDRPFCSENLCTFPTSLYMTNNPRMLEGPNDAQHHQRPSKLRTPHCIPHLIQHHLNILHASPRGNGRIGSSDLFDSGGWVPRSLQVHYQWCTGGRRGAHPWDHNAGLRGHLHKSCNQQPTIPSTQIQNPNTLLILRPYTHLHIYTHPHKPL